MNQKNLYFIAATSLIVVIFWVSSSIYNAMISSTITESLSLQTTPITSEFDIKTIEALKKRQKVESLTDLGGTLQASRSATPSPTPTIATASATLQGESATPSGGTQ